MSTDKSAARLKDGASKICAAFNEAGFVATLHEIDGAPWIHVGEHRFAVTEAYRKRAGTWQVREPNLCIAEDFYCPGTHDRLNALSDVRFLMRRCDGRVAERRRKDEHEAMLAAARAALPSKPSISIEAGSAGRTDAEARFAFWVPIDHAEAFAAHLAAFFKEQG